MTTIDLRKADAVGDDRPYHERYTHKHHWRTQEAEFDGIKLGMWLFLATEVLLFAGMFCGYAVFRMLYPQAWANGSHYLDWKWGTLNTVVLLVSSFTVAMSIHNAQKNQQGWLKINLLITMLCAIAFVAVELTFGYPPQKPRVFLLPGSRAAPLHRQRQDGAGRPVPLRRGVRR